MVVTFANAGTQPGTVMIHLLNADPADIAVAGTGRSVDVAGHAEFESIDLASVG